MRSNQELIVDLRDLNHRFKSENIGNRNFSVRFLVSEIKNMLKLSKSNLVKVQSVNSKYENLDKRR